MINSDSPDSIQLLNEIYKVPEVSLMDKIISYCDMNDYDIQEIGDILSENEQFKKKLWIDCVNFNTIKDELLKKKQHQCTDFDEW